MAARKAKVTAENLAEAARLRALWDAREPRVNQTVFGEQYDIGNQSAVGQFLRGVTPLSAKAAAGFARGLGCSVADFSPRLASLIAQLAGSVDHGNAYLSTKPATSHVQTHEPGGAYASQVTQWPFRGVTAADVASLGPAEIALAEAYLRALIDSRKVAAA